MIRFDAAAYWDRRYRNGRTSGAGSEGVAAVRKARYVSALIERESVRSVVDWGVGDGTVLEHIKLDGVGYVGVDVSPTILDRLRTRFAGVGDFLLPDDTAGCRAELALSLDVIFHLVDDREYELYMRQLFDSSSRLVLIYSTDHDGGRTARHVLWRHWTPYVRRSFPEWSLEEHPTDPKAFGFYLYRRLESSQRQG
jgi:hypothetical protein